MRSQDGNRLREDKGRVLGPSSSHFRVCWEGTQGERGSPSSPQAWDWGLGIFPELCAPV